MACFTESRMILLVEPSSVAVERVFSIFFQVTALQDTSVMFRLGHLVYYSYSTPHLCQI